MLRFLLLWFAAQVWLLLPAPANAASSFTPGDIYLPQDGGQVLVFTSNLASAGQINLSNVRSATGATFNSAGDLVLICSSSNNEVSVREVNAAGQVVHQFDTGTQSLFRGSYIAFDPSRDIFAFANQNKVTFLDSNLAQIGVTGNLFSRASGVAFDSQGDLFATDQFSSSIYEFDRSFSLINTFSGAPYVATGLAVESDGDLLLSSYGNSAVYRLDPVTHLETTLISVGGYGNVSDVIELPNGNLVTANGGGARLFGPNGSQGATVSGSGLGDGVAYFAPVPEPPSLVIVTGTASAIGLARRLARRRWKLRRTL